MEVPSYEAEQPADGDMNNDGDIVDDEYVEPNDEERDRYESRTVTPATEITYSFYNRTTINNTGVISGGRGRGTAPSRNLLSVQDGPCEDLRYQDNANSYNYGISRKRTLTKTTTSVTTRQASKRGRKGTRH